MGGPTLSETPWEPTAVSLSCPRVSQRSLRVICGEWRGPLGQWGIARPGPTAGAWPGLPVAQFRSAEALETDADLAIWPPLSARRHGNMGTIHSLDWKF